MSYLLPTDDQPARDKLLWAPKLLWTLGCHYAWHAFNYTPIYEGGWYAVQAT